MPLWVIEIILNPPSYRGNVRGKGNSSHNHLILHNKEMYAFVLQRKIRENPIPFSFET